MTKKELYGCEEKKKGETCYYFFPKAIASIISAKNKEEAFKKLKDVVEFVDQEDVRIIKEECIEEPITD